MNPVDTEMDATQIFRGSTNTFEPGQDLPATTNGLCLAKLAEDVIVAAGGFARKTAFWTTTAEVGGTWTSLADMSVTRGYAFCGAVQSPSDGVEFVMGGMKKSPSHKYKLYRYQCCLSRPNISQF